MALEAPIVDGNIVGNTFVLEYYNHLCESPATVHKFYHELSVLGRPNLDGDMVYVNTLKDVNDQIMLCDYKNSKIEILEVDSQTSFKNGVATLVMGLVIGKDGERKKFVQCFFLVPQKGSYYVLNDYLRYLSDDLVEPEVRHQVIESSEVVEAVIVSSQGETTVTKPVSAVANGHAKVPKEKVVVEANGHAKVPEKKVVAEAKVQEDAPKGTFASVLGVQTQAQNSTPLVNVKASPVEKPSVAPAEAKAPIPIPEQSSANTIEKPDQGGSIFVANLPLDATREELYETFKGFGAIRRGGIQVRSKWEKKDCYGFVAFENSEAVKRVFQAHKESPIIIGNRRASIEEKRVKDPAAENGGRPYARNNGDHKNENGYKRDKPRDNGSNGGKGNVKQNGAAAGGDGKNI